MKILQIITLSELGGAQTVVINLANKLSEKHEVIVAAGEGDGKMWDLINTNVKKVHCKYLRRAISPINDLFTIIDFLKLYYKIRPDIIHLHSSKAGLLGRIIFPSKKTIYTVHGFDSIRIAHRVFLPIERIMQYACKAIVGVSNYDTKNLNEERINHNTCCIYNGINPIVNEQKLSFNLSRKFSKHILCIARLSPPKDYKLFMEIASILPDYAFVWIGNQKDVKVHPENVFFLGNIPNAGVYNSIADLFILPSNYEGLPMVILEAMSAGKPVVASNVGGISEIVTNGKNGFVVENNPQAFAEKIVYILGNNEIYNSFSENTKFRFLKDLTVNKMVEGYLRIYDLEQY